MLGTLCKVCGFTFSEVSCLTMGQVVRYMRSVTELMPLVNAFAQAPEKPLTGDAGVVALTALGVKTVKKGDG